jgi:hypothetical protein
MLTPDDTQPKRPTTQGQPRRPASAQDGPGCLAWGLLATAGGAFSLLLVFLAGIFGYLSGQGQVETLAQATQQSFIAEQLTTWIPRDIEAGNVELLGARIDGLASLTPAPQEVAGLIATGTQFALDNQPTVTPTPSPTVAATATPMATAQPTMVPAPTAASVSDDGPLFDIDALFAEAQAQINSRSFEEAVLTLEAVAGLDETYRADEVEALLFEAWEAQALGLLRSGNAGDLAAGIRAANAASGYGDIEDLAYESYIAGLYLDAQSKESLNPLGAVTVYSQIYAQAPNYLDVRSKLYNIRVDLGDELYELQDFCPAVEQYQAAAAIQPGGAVEEKLQVAQTSCGTGEAVTPAPLGESSSDGDDGDESGAPAATATNAPIGQR